MARKSPEDAQLTREALIRAALEIFAEKGFAYTTLDMVARRAGVTRGAVYWHFTGKVALLQALLDSCSLPLEGFLGANMALDARLKGLEGALLLTFSNPESRRLSQLLLQPGEPAEGLDVVSNRLQLVQYRIIQQLECMLRDGIRQGELAQDLDVPSTAQVLRTCFTGLICECLREPSAAGLKVKQMLVAVLLMLNASRRVWSVPA